MHPSSEQLNQPIYQNCVSQNNEYKRQPSLPKLAPEDVESVLPDVANMSLDQVKFNFFGEFEDFGLREFFKIRIIVICLMRDFQKSITKDTIHFKPKSVLAKK